MKAELELRVARACKELFEVDIAVELTRPEEQFGDYSTNVALQLAKQLGKAPREVADTLAAKLRDELAEQVSEISVAGPGFLNLKLNDKALTASLKLEPQQSLAGQTVVAEYSDPNPFKVLHAGHLYTSVVGDAIANLLEQAGAKVHRVNFGGDVGLHVAKTMWAIIKELGGEENLAKLDNVPKNERLNWISGLYVQGNNTYESDEQAKSVIVSLNKRIYDIHAKNDKTSELAQIYWTCWQWSYEGFKNFYESINIHPFDKYYPESETVKLGVDTVKEQLEKGVYEKSDGAVIFDGEKYGLHKRVFINSQDLPTYEAKDVGLIMKKWQDYHFDKSVVITGNDIIEYMKVVLRSIEQFAPELTERTTHITHGIVKLISGEKMSSRTGNILRASDILVSATLAIEESGRDPKAETMIGAVKYAFLKQRLGGDIIYDPAESVSLEGNSGPYLQYAHARAQSILRKAGEPTELGDDTQFEAAERSLARKISEYPEVVDKAVAELMPHHVCTYLYELAQTFNRFYETNRVIDDPRQATRLSLVAGYAQTLHDGLQLLGITAPDRM